MYTTFRRNGEPARGMVSFQANVESPRIVTPKGVKHHIVQPTLAVIAANAVLVLLSVVALAAHEHAWSMVDLEGFEAGNHSFCSGFVPAVFPLLEYVTDLNIICSFRLVDQRVLGVSPCGNCVVGARTGDVFVACTPQSFGSVMADEASRNPVADIHDRTRRDNRYCARNSQYGGEAHALGPGTNVS